ncbi:amidohydrolase [Leucobacter luti]|uniref:amidohydrolase n=1 Tax=Leucobacter luti TaxID=340320 RepID=UPI003D0073F6
MIIDALITNARVLTMDPERPTATRLGIWNGRIVGLDEELEGLRARRVIDAGGMTVLPGFHDAHNHMATFGRSLLNIDAGALGSLDELYAAVRTRADEDPEREWIIADAYDQRALGGHPTREGLDAAAPGRNVIVNHRTTHMLVASTPVFERVGALHTDWPVPSGGFVERDERGAPVGLVGEQAMAAFRDLSRPHSVEVLADALGRASDRFLSEGITAVGEAGIGDSPVVGSSPIELLPYQVARERGRLGVRVRLMVSMENLHGVVSAPDDLIDLGLDLGLRTGFGDDFLGIGALKMFTDGAISSRTAALDEPYCDHGGHGVMQFGREELTALASSATRAGWQLAVHAIGDHANDVALDVIETAAAGAPGNGFRHRIEHASILRDDQVRRMAAAGITASIQPEFVSALGDSVLAGLGERGPWTYRHRSLIEAGIPVALGSDRPVVSGHPLRGVRDSVLRLTSSGAAFSPGEAVDVMTALRGYTRDSAAAIGMADRLGVLRAGAYADLAVLDGDPLTADPASLPDIAVAATAVAGDFLFDPSGLAQ